MTDFSAAIRRKPSWLILGVLLLGSSCQRAAPPPAPRVAGKEIVVAMEEISVFDDDRCAPLRLGQPTTCQPGCPPGVKCPALASKRPWYGSVNFGAGAGRPVWFFAVDASSGQPIYDRLYFDANHDNDLTNDPVIEAQRDPPANVLPPGSAEQKTAFHELTISFDSGPGRGVQTVELLPLLFIHEYQNQPMVTLRFAATKARRGRVRLGEQDFIAILGQQYGITGRFDLPGTYLQLMPIDVAQPPKWYCGQESLNAMRWLAGRFYTTHATAAGDRLFVAPYVGDLGTFKIGPGDRKLDRIGGFGPLHSRDNPVLVGDMFAQTPEAMKVQECQLPERDYFPGPLSIEYGRLGVLVSNNYHTDSQSPKKKVYGIKIRKDKPFVLDFSNAPEVLFFAPRPDTTVYRGGFVEVKAVLIDPVLDIMIQDLHDMTRKVKKTYGEGENRRTCEQPLALDPTVTITDSSGKMVAQGVMPFG